MKRKEPIRVPERRRCEFFVVRYVPDAIKDEFVNVGVVMFAGAEDGQEAWADVRFTHDWRRVRCLDPEADVELLEGFEREIKDKLSEGGATRDWLMKRMADTFSNAVQLTVPKAVLADSPVEEIARLAEMYLERPKRGGRVVSGRQAIFAAMRGEFERRGVWTHMRHSIPAAQYTHKGDPLKIDCGYRPNGTVHLYHALALESDLNAAKALAFSYPKLRDGIRAAEKAETTLTAVVESELDRVDDGVMFALATLKSSEIVVATLDEVPRIAEHVAQQMGM